MDVISICHIRKNPALQDSPPAAGRNGDMIPFRRSAILAERFWFHRTHFPMKPKEAAALTRAAAFSYERLII